MVQYSMENGNVINNMDLEANNGQMELNMKETIF